jgi:hypothetical protein
VGAHTRPTSLTCWFLVVHELPAGSALQRFGVLEAGIASTKDPRYIVIPQRERVDARG